MSKTIVVFGASGIIGQGFIKTTLEKGMIYKFCDFSSHFNLLRVMAATCMVDLRFNLIVPLMQLVSKLWEYSDQKSQQRRFLLG